LRGKVAIANASSPSWYQQMIAGERWKKLAAKARCRSGCSGLDRVKDPAYPDTLYIDTLIGADTVNTMPPKTMDAFRDHGVVAETLPRCREARKSSARPSAGPRPRRVTAALVEDGSSSSPMPPRAARRGRRKRAAILG